MMKDNKTSAITRQVHFANGFPPKGLVQAAVPYGRSSYTAPGGHYVSLDEVSPGRLGRTHRTIPPLAKGRGQFCSMRDRPEDDRYRRRPDPFKLPKAAEKTGFSASQIKRAKPRMIRMCRSTEPPSPPPATSTVYNLKNLARRTVYSTPPNRPLESDPEDDIIPPSLELKAKNSRIISDVEKESIQAELAGLGEVYQRVCRGKMESLYSLLYPSRRDVKRVPVQYINTSAPVQLRTPKITQHTKKVAKDQSHAMAVTVATNDIEKTKNEENGSHSFPDSEAKQENATRPILIPLPYIRSDTGIATPAKQQKPAYHVPYIYSNRNTKAATQHSRTPNYNTAAPAVITFNPMNIPDLSRPGTKNGALTGGATTTLNKSSSSTANVVSDALIQDSIPAPFVSPGPFKGTTPNHTPALVDGKSDLLGKLDIESVDSEVDYPVESVTMVTDSSPGNEHDAGNSANNKDGEEIALNGKKNTNAENVVEEIVTRGIRLSLTTDGGLEGGLEIFDYNKRDLESEQLAAKQIEELEEIGERKMKEYKELLEEHQHILDEVKHLEEELHKKPNE
ncbi:hypothetical protein ACROYT_G035415 [Oculina patagonica]